MPAALDQAREAGVQTTVAYGRADRFVAQPADAVRSLWAVAALKGLDEAAVAEQTTCNAETLFGLGFSR